jgi:tocopherol cyclase
MYFKKLKYPEYFQGNHRKDHYFEGWYYKLVNKDQSYTIAFIPGVSLVKDDAHAFIQVFISHRVDDDVNLKTFYFRFEMKDFSYGHDDFWVKIGKNYFSREKIEISLMNDQIELSGRIGFDALTPLKRTLLMPNIMGFFGYFNFMECYHGVVSMNHNLNGNLRVNNKSVVFNTGKGYIEKDWGKSFPRSYVWLQSNHFKDSGTSLLFSYADIPFLGLYFKGLIVNLVINQKEYRFSTYNGAKIKLEELKEGYVHYIVKKGPYLLELEATSKTQIGLASPKNGRMVEQIKEGLSGSIHMKLYKKEVLILEDTGLHAGIEIMKQSLK